MDNIQLQLQYFACNRVANIETFDKFGHIIWDRVRLKYDALYALNNDLFICYTRVFSVLLSLIAVTEVVLVTSSDKKKYIGDNG